MDFKEYLKEDSKEMLDAKNSYYYFILKPYVGKTIGDFQFDIEPMMGTFFFGNEDDNPKYEIVYATPYWEGANGIPVDVHKEMGDTPKRTIVKLPAITGDSKKDAAGYFKVMTNVFKKLK
jgi:hypothetical protein